MKRWQLQEAKARFSELIKIAISKGPQDITVRGEPAVVVISREDFDRLTKPKASFIKFMRSSPLAGLNLELKRDKSLTRDVKL